MNLDGLVKLIEVYKPTQAAWVCCFIHMAFFSQQHYVYCTILINAAYLRARLWMWKIGTFFCILTSEIYRNFWMQPVQFRHQKSPKVRGFPKLLNHMTSTYHGVLWTPRPSMHCILFCCIAAAVVHLAFHKTIQASTCMVLVFLSLGEKLLLSLPNPTCA